MYNKGRYHEVRLVVCLLASIIILAIDNASSYSGGLKGKLEYIFTPVYQVVKAPQRFIANVTTYFVNQGVILNENELLKSENLKLQGTLQKFNFLKQENQKLRELLRSSNKVSDKFLVSDILRVISEPGVQQLVLNQGSNSGVFVGQAVIDAYGVVGQVLSVSPVSSRVLLITDLEHSIPVEIARNNMRAIAVGTGDSSQLELTNVVNTADILNGDIIISSGLGKRFPAGYPIGKVISVDKNPALPFAKIIIEPLAKLQQIKEVLLIWPGEGTAVVPNLDVDDEPEKEKEKTKERDKVPAVP